MTQSTADILKKVRKIEIKSKGLSSHIFSGAYHSTFKGRGMSFSEVREYTPGDDVRNIDWNVTARFSTPFIKVFEEERELCVMLLVDISNSSLFGTTKQIKRDIITEICAVLAFSATTNNDTIGVIFFSDKIDKYIPPAKGRSHILRIIRELLSITPVQKELTDIGACLRFFNNVIRKRSIAFLISDFISKPYTEPLKISARKHDVIGIKIYDKADKILPSAGLIQVQDSETGKLKWIDTNDKSLQKFYTKSFEEQAQYCKNTFNKSRAELIPIQSDEDYVKKLQGFFSGRK